MSAVEQFFYDHPVFNEKKQRWRRWRCSVNKD